MKRLLMPLAILMLLLVTFLPRLTAQEKVIEKSGKKADWVNSVAKGYIIETVSYTHLTLPTKRIV